MASRMEPRTYVIFERKTREWDTQTQTRKTKRHIIEAGDERLVFESSEKTDEGWHSQRDVYWVEVEFGHDLHMPIYWLYHYEEVESKDCDGRMDTNEKSRLRLETLDGELYVQGRNAAWQLLDEHQRDHSAEAAGF